MKNLLVTGGAGFIGANFVHYMLQNYADLTITVYDKLTYAGNLENLAPVADDSRYAFYKGDICDTAAVDDAMQKHNIANQALQNAVSLKLHRPAVDSRN